MSYVLATTEDKVRWYKYKFDQNFKAGEGVLGNFRFKTIVPLLGESDSERCSEGTWRYIKL